MHIRTHKVNTFRSAGERATARATQNTSARSQLEGVTERRRTGGTAFLNAPTSLIAWTSSPDLQITQI
jgi:hypothetical protein